jgi:two-component system sensor histidine kinase QseC
MTLQRRLLLLLLIAVPLIWAIAVVTSLLRARHEVNELFDTDQIRLAQQVLALVEHWGDSEGEPPATGAVLPRVDTTSGMGGQGAAELQDLSIAVWTADGRLRYADGEGAQLPLRRGGTGFGNVAIGGEPWRIFYLASGDAGWLVAVGQAEEERDEVMQGLLAGQLLPWILMLPVLLIAMAIVVRHALRPVRTLAADLAARGADDLHPIATEGLPAELGPLAGAMNRLFDQIRQTLEHERRLTADAAHELRTPLAAVRAQWEAVQVAHGPEAQASALRQVGAGIQRLERLASQLLALAGLDARREFVHATPVDWRRVIQDALSDCLALAEATSGEIEVEWPAGDAPAMPLAGDETLLSLLVRNLVDNALRHAGPGAHVRLLLTTEALVVEDDGPGVRPEALARLGDRFFRAAGQAIQGSGLGLSIVYRVAELHRLQVAIANRAPPAHGLRVTLSRAA